MERSRISPGLSRRCRSGQQRLPLSAHCRRLRPYSQDGRLKGESWSNDHCRGASGPFWVSALLFETDFKCLSRLATSSAVFLMAALIPENSSHSARNTSGGEPPKTEQGLAIGWIHPILSGRPTARTRHHHCSELRGRPVLHARNMTMPRVSAVIGRTKTPMIQLKAGSRS